MPILWSGLLRAEGTYRRTGVRQCSGSFKGGRLWSLPLRGSRLRLITAPSPLPAYFQSFFGTPCWAAALNASLRVGLWVGAYVLRTLFAFQCAPRLFQKGTACRRCNRPLEILSRLILAQTGLQNFKVATAKLPHGDLSIRIIHHGPEGT